MIVKDWMTHDVLTASPDMPISDAHQIMKERGIRRLPVVEHEKLVGIVTIGDVREASPSDATTLSIWELNYLWAQLTVGKIMSKNVLTVKADTPILDAAEMMLENKISGLPVVGKGGHLEGIITESDIFRLLVRSRVATPD
ncbi:CBS domain-containing protein [Phototrophicus methaneseepsis]|uniref:CBS domain-containing protein n=1 Tax=Phototrophicus methaneseepsis TaxID=2710758 RepID=A0A7S8IFX9_9CHLR|nr:CBS domain-containing protein [Phototrophicus methaneseepsis]